MARNGSGTFSNPYPTFVSGTTISSTQVNANNSDIATALTQSIAVDGQSTVTANLPMNAKKLTGLAVGAAATDSLNLGQAQAEAMHWCGTAGGSANAITLSPSPAITAYAAGQRFVWKASGSANTGATTVAISGLGTIALQDNGAALVAGNHAANKIFMGILDTASTMQVMQVQLSGTDPLIVTSLTVSGAATIGGVTTHGGNVVSDTDSTDDLGTTSVRWKDLFVDSITATDQVTATGFTGTLDGVLGGGTPASASITTLGFTSLSGTGSVAITDILDEDNMASNSATKLSTQQSIKAYVDSQVGAADTLAEVLALGNTTTTDQKIQFRDTGIYLNSSADGQLDIVADTEIQIAATTIDINGAVALSGAITGATNITLSGELDAATLDISGNADIDGILEADAMTLNGTAITATATLDTGISNNNLPKFTSGVADNDFLRVDGTAVEGRSATEVLSDIAAAPAAGSSNIVTTGALNSGSITSGFGTIDTGSSTITTTGLISGGSLDIDSVLINGSTIGHTDDTDLMTVASGLLTVAGEVSMTTLDIGGTNVTSTAAELNILDGVTSTTAEINLIDGGTARGTTAVASGDGILINDAGTMRQTNVDTVSTYFASHSVGGGNIVTTGALNAGSITSGFGNIDTGSSTITTTGLISGGSLDIDSVLINGSTIGHTDDTDLMTVADGLLTVAGKIAVNTLAIGGDDVTSTAAELNILDGVTSTAAELNILDGATVVVGEINALDIGSTAVGTAVASKAVILDSNKDYTGVRNLTLTGALTVPDGSIPIADLDIDGGTDIGADIVDADLFIIDDGAGGANKKVTAARLKTYAGGGGSGTDWEVISSTGSVSAGTYLEITGFNMVRVQAVHTVTGTAHSHGINLSTSGSSNSGVSTQNGQYWRMSGATTPSNATGAYSPATNTLYMGSNDNSNEPYNLELNLYGLDETNVGIMAQEMALSSNALNRWTGQTASGSSTWFLYFNHALDTTLVVGCK